MTDAVSASNSPALVMVPGLGLQAAAWRPTIDGLEGLRGRARVVALPGFGLPRDGAESLDPSALGGRLAAMLGDSPVVLCGHSASCQVVAHAANASPAVAGLVLVGPTTDPRSRSWTSLGRRWLATARHEPPWQVPTLVQQYRRTGLHTIWTAMDAARRDSLESSLRGVARPVLLVRGPRDRIAPASWLTTLSSVDAPAGRTQQRVELSSGGHMVPITEGRALADVIELFVAQLSLR